MNSELLKKAHEKISSTPVLINLISKRERELINGAKPLVKPQSLDEDKCDIALREVAEGKLIAETETQAHHQAKNQRDHRNVVADRRHCVLADELP